MEKRKKRLKKAQEKRDKKEGNTAKQIQIVPQKKFEDFDKDELAMDLAIAKKMLRKKERRELLESGVNRYNYPEKPEDLPEWFRDDESKHTHIIEPVTKEEVLAEKLRLKEIDAKPPKKVIEAKYRNKLRLVKKLKKFKSQADQIFETEGLDQKTKVQTIDKLKRKTLFMANKQTKKVIPVRGFRTSAPVSRKTAGKRYKTVDTRLKKDTKA
jgi:AdoMet-dependent rRNA methyltransferase SPB1